MPGCPSRPARSTDRPAFASARTGTARTQATTTRPKDLRRPKAPPPPPTASPPPVWPPTAPCRASGFTLPGPAGDITACHCRQCRKLSGHYSASFDANEAAVAWQARAGLADYATPGGGRRGFCTGCGSSLWFRAADGAFSIEAGAGEGRTGGRLSGHIFVADKGDWYDIADGLPQAAAW